MAFETISVIGLGYIGLPTAAIFASRKVYVTGVDVNEDTVNTINRGQVHIIEPDLDAVVDKAVRDGYLKAVAEPEPADAFLVAVPTPFVGDDHEPDLRYIRAAARSIAPVLKAGDLVVLESTSPVGATESMAEWLAEARPDLSFPQERGEKSDIRIAHCPERVLPGNVMRELVENDRVIGGMTPRCSRRAVDLYNTFVSGDCIITNARTAEMCKLTENSFRDVNIAFANELSILCDKSNINPWELISLANRHPRVNILKPGAGVGGHCIAVDPWFIASKFPDEAKLIRAARVINDQKPDWVIKKFQAQVSALKEEKSLHDIVVACYGLSFKPDIDDLRESPALEIAASISQISTNEILIVEPHIETLPDELQNSSLVDVETAIAAADIHVFLVPHSLFAAAKTKLQSLRYYVDPIGLIDGVQ